MFFGKLYYTSIRNLRLEERDNLALHCLSLCCKSAKVRLLFLLYTFR